MIYPDPDFVENSDSAHDLLLTNDLLFTRWLTDDLLFTWWPASYLMAYFTWAIFYHFVDNEWPLVCLLSLTYLLVYDLVLTTQPNLYLMDNFYMLNYLWYNDLLVFLILQAKSPGIYIARSGVHTCWFDVHVFFGLADLLEKLAQCPGWSFILLTLSS